MKTISKLFLFVAIILAGNTASAQYLPSSYEAILTEISENFKEIRGGNSITEGKSSLRKLSDDKIILKMDHKKSVKTLTFVKKLDEEGEKFWYADNKLTTDTVNKYEKDVTKLLNKMLDLSIKEAKK